MSSSMCYYLTVAVVCWYVVVAAAAPRHAHKKHAVHVKKRNSETSKEQLTIELPQVLNKTVCPIVSVVDHDPDRIPQRIKMLKCAPTPSPVCRQEGMEEQVCCGHKHERFNTQCVELLDNVVVQDLSGGEPRLRTVQVSVGCSCMVRPTRAAEEDA